MKQIAKTLTDVSASRQLTGEELAQVSGGFNPQPDPPARQGLPSNTLIQPVPEGDRFAIGAMGIIRTG
ncbi:MAG TPA: hypothetical protein VH678_12745 [Xanthobacteraceae bacterium]|jgi:hypothetical protein